MHLSRGMSGLPSSWFPIWEQRQVVANMGSRVPCRTVQYGVVPAPQSPYDMSTVMPQQV
jgi:hypothetical protein